MRIGEITQDNYMDYIKLFGGKNTKTLDAMWGKDKKSKSEGSNKYGSCAKIIVLQYMDIFLQISTPEKSWII